MTTFKEVFDLYTTPNIELKTKPNKYPLPILAICCLVLIAVILKPSSNTKIPIDIPSTSTSEIYINELHKIDIIDSNLLLNEATDLQYPFINELEKQYSLLDSKIVYTSENQPDTKCGYNQLDSYRLSFEDFTISFSETNIPASDYSMSKDRPQYSKINEVDVAIYGYENTYYASFEYNHMFFEIESTMTIEELVGVLNTIIK